MLRRDTILGLSIALLFTFVGILTLEDYGAVYDSMFQLKSGLAHLNFLKTGKLEIVGFDPCHGPVADIISTLSHILFYQKLHLLSYWGSFHLPIILFGGTTIFITYLFALEIYGREAAIIAAISLGLLPIFLWDMHNNVKDIPLTAFFVLSIRSFYGAIINKNIKKLILAAFFAGLAWSVKLTAVFIPFILGLWILISYRDKINIFNIGQWKLFLLYSLVSIIIGIITYPWLWNNPIMRIMERFGWIAEVGKSGKLGGNMPIPTFYLGKWYYATIDTLPWHYPFVVLSRRAPLVMIILGSISLPLVLREIWGSKGKRSIALLLLLWFIIPLITFSFFGKYIYAVRRQCMMIYPVLAIMCGIGGAFIYKVAIKKLMIYFNRYICRGIMILTFLLFYLPLLISLIETHPYQCYVITPIIKEIKSDTTFFPSSAVDTQLKEGADWLNKYASKGASVHIYHGGRLLTIYLRSDIKVFNQQETDTDYIMFYNLLRLSEKEKFCLDNLGPCYTIKVKSRPILYIYDTRSYHWDESERRLIKKY